jgi:hypothetical protein
MAKPKSKEKAQQDNAGGSKVIRRTADALEKAAEVAKASRRRIPKRMPSPVENGSTAWSNKRGELAGFHVGEQARVLKESEEYNEHLRPFLAHEPGRSDWQYAREELELGEFAQRAAGFADKKTFIEKIQLMKLAVVRKALGYDKPRNPEHRLRRLTNTPDGVPSEATFSRHNRSLDIEERATRWERVAYALRDRYLSMPGVAEELRTINIDGFHIPIPFTAPRYETDDDGVVYIANAEYVTAPEAGYLPKASHGHGSTGFALVMAVTSRGTPLGWRHARIHDPEVPLAIEVTRQELVPLFRAHVEPHGVLGVITADGNFATNPLRQAIREAGYVDNIHHVSHANKERAADLRTHWIPFDGYDDKWGTNGHYDVVCYCGEGRLSRVFQRDKSGVVGCRVYGECATCGFISVTSGEWVRNSNPPRWERRDPSDKAAAPNLAVGNGMTFDYWLAEELGKQRFYYCEGFFGALVNRWKLGFGKRYFKSLAEARLETAMVMASIYICSIERANRAAAAALLAA